MGGTMTAHGGAATGMVWEHGFVSFATLWGHGKRANVGRKAAQVAKHT
jgi:hypothetical protein